MLKYLAVSCLTFSLCAGVSSAQVRHADDDRWEVSFFYGVASAGDKAAATPVDGQDLPRLVVLDFASGYTAGVRITENRGRHFGAELEYGFANQPMALVDLRPGLGRLDSDHRIHSLTYSVLFYPLERDSRLRPYVSAGIGTAFFQVSGDSKAEASTEGIELKDRWKLAGGWGAGVKYRMNPNWGVRVDLRNQFTGVPDYGLPRRSSTFQGSVRPAFNADGSLSSWHFSAGVFFYLGG
jgi:opacity protein-like surface antigen